MPGERGVNLPEPGQIAREVVLRNRRGIAPREWALSKHVARMSAQRDIRESRMSLRSCGLHVLAMTS